MRAATTPRRGPTWQLQVATAARMFFLEGRSKVEIADVLGLSRFKVARLLDEARELGVVRVEVRLPSPVDAVASEAVAAHLGLRRALVLTDGVDDVVAECGRLAAELLAEQVGGDDVLGLTCSRHVSAMTQAMDRLAGCDVVQLTGTLAGRHGAAGSVESVRRAADVGGGRAHPVYVPMLLGDRATAESLAQQDEVRHAFDRIPEVTVAVVAAGAWADGLSTVWASATPEERAAAAAAGAIGEIGGRTFDERGGPVTAGVDERVLGMRLEQLRAVPEVIVLSHGPERAAAVRATVVGGISDTVVCDHAHAQALLALPPIEDRTRS